MFVLSVLISIGKVRGYQHTLRKRITYFNSDTKLPVNTNTALYFSSISKHNTEILHQGLVIERLSDKLLVEYKNGDTDHLKQILCNQRVPVGKSIVVGDVVRLIVDETAGKVEGTVIDNHERMNVLERPAPASEGRYKISMKAIASNIDQVIIVTASKPIVPLYTIDQLIVGATLLNIPNIAICINKSDLDGALEVYLRYKHYRALNYPTFMTSTVSSIGTKQLEDVMMNKTSIFVGQSGVGKSSLVNQLIPERIARVGDLVKKVDMGAHTTSNARLYHMLNGGRVIDSPGIREFGLWQYTKDQITRGFVEIDKFSQECKFSDCNHDEKAHGCVVMKAIVKGDIDASRFANYKKFVLSALPER